VVSQLFIMIGNSGNLGKESRILYLA